MLFRVRNTCVFRTGEAAPGSHWQGYSDQLLRKKEGILQPSGPGARLGNLRTRMLRTSNGGHPFGSYAEGLSAITMFWNCTIFLGRGSVRATPQRLESANANRLAVSFHQGSCADIRILAAASSRLRAGSLARAARTTSSLSKQKDAANRTRSFMRKATCSVIAGKPPAEAAQPSGMNGMIVEVAIKVPAEPKAPRTPSFLFQNPANKSAPKSHSETPRK
jgi:hypothetical protein